MTSRHIVIVGASAAGLAVVESLRRGSCADAVTLIGAERELPYDRPPLSKKVLDGSWEPSRARLREQDHIDALGADFRLGVRASGVDTARRRVKLESGEEVGYDDLVIATGVAPRRLPFGNDLTGVHVLRRLDDSLALRADLLEGGPLVVIGAGPLGCEVAATATRMGLDVALVDVLALPMVRLVGPEVAERLAELHRSHGVALHLSAGVAGIQGSGERVQAVELSDGSRLPAHTVLVAIGCAPVTEWLAGSGIPLADGVVCDERCQAAEHVYAAGDVAEWFNPRFGVRMRVEHRMNANEQGSVVAANLLGEGRHYDPIPHFWSDQYDLKLQAHGVLAPGATVAIESHDDERGRFAAVYSDGGIVHGVLGWNIPREIRGYRAIVGEPVPVEPVRT
jgi:3-phenylpropionate/trans-cinnamate dioxygenase ferredoxin reductase component